MIDHIQRPIRLLALFALVELAACPWSSGRGSASNCIFFTNTIWQINQLDYFLSEPSTCPVQIPDERRVYYAANVYAPEENIADQRFTTIVYSASGVLVGSDGAFWFYTDWFN